MHMNVSIVTDLVRLNSVAMVLHRVLLPCMYGGGAERGNDSVAVAEWGSDLLLPHRHGLCNWLFIPRPRI